MAEAGVGLTMLAFAGFIILFALFGASDAPDYSQVPALARLSQEPCAQEQVEKFVYGGFGTKEIVQYCPEKSADPKALAGTARSGNWAAAVKLGDMYRHGLTVSSDPAEALAWYAFARDLRPDDPALEKTMAEARAAAGEAAAWQADRRLAELRREAVADAGRGAPSRPAMPDVVFMPPVYGSPYPWVSPFPWVGGPVIRSFPDPRRYQALPAAPQRYAPRVIRPPRVSSPPRTFNRTINRPGAFRRR